MLIHFVHEGDAYLPELQAYSEFLQAKGHEAQVHRHVETIPSNPQVLWWMCGQVPTEIAQRCSAAFHIHEYASASVPPMAWLKDRIKRARQPLPNYRIFQNKWVRQRMGFGDGVPSEFRDMGIAVGFFNQPPAQDFPEFDFVYLGEMRRLQHFPRVFEALAELRRRVLLVGEVPADLKVGFGRDPSVTVTGRVPHGDVPSQLRRARFGLNLVPGQSPYIQQTSTKLIEYCAVGLSVVSTDYQWVRDFEQQRDGRFAYIPLRASTAAYRDILGPALDTQVLKVPDVNALAWPRLLSAMKIWRRIGLAL